MLIKYSGKYVKIYFNMKITYSYSYLYSSFCCPFGPFSFFRFFFFCALFFSSSVFYSYLSFGSSSSFFCLSSFVFCSTSLFDPCVPSSGILCSSSCSSGSAPFFFLSFLLLALRFALLRWCSSRVPSGLF